MRQFPIIACTFGLIGIFAVFAVADDPAPKGWQTAAPRNEIKPFFEFYAKAGRNGGGALAIWSDKREGLDGYWHKSFPVVGGRYYQFDAHRKT